MMKLPRLLPVFVIAAATPFARAEIVPHPLFSDNAVLQQDMEVPVWGTARNGEKVTVRIAGQVVSTTAKEGKWMVRFNELKAGGPFTMTLKGDNEITLKNILVGEVWVCSGQSNMERQLGLRPPQKPIFDWEAEVAAANYPQIRHVQIPFVAVDAPQSSVQCQWTVCSPQSVQAFTAVGYFFGRDLYRARKVPVGLIHSSKGGTPAEAWTRHEVLVSDPLLAAIPAQHARNLATFEERLAKFKAQEPKLMAAHKAAVEKAKAQGQRLPRIPVAPVNPATDRNRPACLYNGMIAPLLPYAMRGVIWYQGESNSGNAKCYQTLFPAMIADWRKQWGQGAFPFLFVQIAPYSGMKPEIREAQFLTWQRTPGTAMAVTTDCGDAEDIHPIHKQPVGARLALAARALAYGEPIEYSGPAYAGLKIQGSRAVVSFTHLGGGLLAKGGPLKGFTIAGADGKFEPAQAEIVGDNVVVSSQQVAMPVAVRYGWANVPEVNLFNKADLPASPFRTDEALGAK